MELNGIEGLIKKPEIVDANYDNSKMENEDFLKVLLADLQWQDPLNAKDISDFINNTVKLRQMEVLNNFQETVELLKEASQANSLLYASNLIGKKIFYEGNYTYVENGQSTVKFKLEDNADFVKITVMSSDGTVVEQRSFADLEGNKEYPFEISNPDLQDGYYTVYIEATKGDRAVKATVISEGIVSSVLKESDSIKAVVNNTEIDINSIAEIGG
ncbi:flagellar hook capping protein [Persephonella atlantica]|uniref:Basal-body rod modification protein FlgD n=1 Tax=Persephonella atlantica TaxID=2699429 RepID=A0ABS1GHS8_9AQUI|nr:flagellar hook capping FlgD N-terminal domain-containing protein [Persephonella atlantica]MBK3332467.1 flagellar hook capping protein [Persephonella atlantica]